MSHLLKIAKALMHDRTEAGRWLYTESWPPEGFNGVDSTSHTSELKFWTSMSSAVVACSRAVNQPVRSADWISRRSEATRISYNGVS